MDPRPTRWPALLFLLLLTLLPARPPTLAAGRPGEARRAAVASGPCVERAEPVMGDVLSIAAASRGGVTDTSRVAAALDLAFGEARRLAVVFAPDDAGSELAGMNRAAADRRVGCSAELYGVLEAALALAGESEGAYDPTTGPLLRAWDRRRDSRAPEPGELSTARLLVGWRMLQLDPAVRTVRFLRSGMEVTPGAVARGALLERVAQVLRGRGIVRARLELGGDVFAYTNHEAWTAAVTDPSGPGRTAITLALSNAAAATARTGLEGSARVLDPRTGQPPMGEASVTVVERSALRARAVAEALLVRGRESAEAYARDHPATGVLWLEPFDGGVRAWAWNLGRLQPEPDARVEWMTRP